MLFSVYQHYDKNKELQIFQEKAQVTQFMNKYKDLTYWLHFPEGGALGTVPTDVITLNFTTEETFR